MQALTEQNITWGNARAIVRMRHTKIQAVIQTNDQRGGRTRKDIFLRIGILRNGLPSSCTWYASLNNDIGQEFGEDHYKRTRIVIFGLLDL